MENQGKRRISGGRDRRQQKTEGGTTKTFEKPKAISPWGPMPVHSEKKKRNAYRAEDGGGQGKGASDQLVKMHRKQARSTTTEREEDGREGQDWFGGKNGTFFKEET